VKVGVAPTPGDARVEVGYRGKPNVRYFVGVGGYIGSPEQLFIIEYIADLCR